MLLTLKPMDCSSETESDSSYSPSRHPSFQNPPVDATFLTWDPRHPQWSTEQPLTLQGIRREIQTLLEQDMPYLMKVANITDSVLLSSASLLKFLTCMPGLLADNKDLPVITAAFSALVTPQFIERLFEYRKLFRSASLRVMVVPENPIVETWVDVFLARLSLLVGPLASGTIRAKYPGPVRLESIELQRQDDSVRATSQLPEHWHDLKFVIGSYNFSPAAKRIALSLMFAAYVMGPQLTLAGSWPQPGPPSVDILDPLFVAARHMSSQVQSPSMSFDSCRERTTMAMLISLISVVEGVVHPNAKALRISQLRPEGLGYLLDLIWIVIGPEADSILPLEELDLPQIILLRWGDTVPWSWSTWTDERNANTEHLRLVTATWLYHINRPLLSALPPSENEKIFGTDLRCCLFTDTAASSFVILNLLQNIVSKVIQGGLHGSTPHPTLPGLLGKLCWATVQYLEMNSTKAHPAIQGRIAEYARCLLILFCFLESSEEGISVQGLIIEALALVSPQFLSSSLQSILQNKQIQFVRRLDQATRSRASALSQNEGHSVELFLALNAAKSLLDFLTIILLQDEARNATIHGIVSLYLGVLFKLLRSPGHKFLEAILFNPLLMTLCAFQIVVAPRLMAEFNHNDICNLAVHAEHRKIVTAGTFAQYLLATDRVCEGPLCYETWDFLLSTLAAIIDPDILQEDEPLALLTCTAVCAALKKLICSFNPFIRRSILSSPWTVSIGIALRNIFGDEIHSLSYFVELNMKLGKTGESLLKSIATEDEEILDAQTPDMAVDDAISSTQSGIRLLYYRDDRDFGLLLTYDVSV